MPLGLVKGGRDGGGGWGEPLEEIRDKNQRTNVHSSALVSCSPFTSSLVGTLYLSSYPSLVSPGTLPLGTVGLSEVGV